MHKLPGEIHRSKSARYRTKSRECFRRKSVRIFSNCRVKCWWFISPIQSETFALIYDTWRENAFVRKPQRAIPFNADIIRRSETSELPLSTRQRIQKLFKFDNIVIHCTKRRNSESERRAGEKNDGRKNRSSRGRR